MAETRLVTPLGRARWIVSTTAGDGSSELAAFDSLIDARAALGAFLADVDDALSDDPSDYDAYVRSGAIFFDHAKKLREVLAALGPESEGE